MDGIPRATWIVSLTFLASCGSSSRPHFAIVALASPPTSPKWVRLDAASGDMIVCTADSRLPESAPPPPAGTVVGSTYLCESATTGKVINWKDLK